jgi:antitoxin ParD1/3/4
MRSCSSVGQVLQQLKQQAEDAARHQSQKFKHRAPVSQWLRPGHGRCGMNSCYHVGANGEVGSMSTTVEKISIALPPEMAALVRQAVEAGEYASNSEVIRDALRDWTHKRLLQQQGVDELRQVWQQALNDPRPAVAADEVLDRLERKYQSMVNAAAPQR